MFTYPLAFVARDAFHGMVGKWLLNHLGAHFQNVYMFCDGLGLLGSHCTSGTYTHHGGIPQSVNVSIEGISGIGRILLCVVFSGS